MQWFATHKKQHQVVRGTMLKIKKRAKSVKCNKMITWFFFILSNIALAVDTASFKIRPLMVLKNKSNRKCKLTYNLHHKYFTVCNIVTLLIAKHSGDEKNS
jgi:hypothetical protein